MKREIHLWIGGREAECTNLPDILFTFQIDDVTNPAAVKNSYTKTIDLPGTAKNNMIFGNSGLNDQTASGAFDPSKKMPFTIYVDNELYQTGYCKLNEIVNKKGTSYYNISLFGTLGDFFQNLEYGTGDEKRKLSSLEFNTDTPIEFDINKEAIESAWDEIDGASSKWSVINFAPAYDGLPKDFDAGKCLVNTHGMTGGGRGRGAVITTYHNEGTGDTVTSYTTYDGYVLADMNRNYTAAEMREFRSYLMRPVVRAKRVIEAICDPQNNGGFEVELDDEWFATDNCYYEDLWVTLPTLSSLDYTTNAVDSSVTVTTGAAATGTTASGDPGYFKDTLAVLSQPDSGYGYDVTVTANLDILGVSNTSHDKLVVAGWSKNYAYASAIFVQLVAYDSAGNALAGSPEYYITSAYGPRHSGTTTYMYYIPPQNFDHKTPYGNEYISARRDGYFVQQAGTTYRWNEDIKLTAKNVPANSTLKLLVTKLYKKGSSSNNAKTVLYRAAATGQKNTYSAYTFNDFSISIKSSSVSFHTNAGIRTGAHFSKEQLLDTEYSPCDFLLSYAKCFALYFLQDPIRQKITILTRNKFFQRDNITDIQRFVDRQNVKITPLVFDSKWYKWDLEADESEYGKEYEEVYGKKYGQQLVDTSYNFNSETKDVLEGNVFKSAVQVLERSNAFCYVGNDTVQKPWMFGGYKYLLYDTTDATNTYEVEVNPSSTIDAFSGFTDNYMYYDLFEKVQLHTADNNPADGSNVLLIRSHDRDLVANGQRMNYYITDDNSVMNILNQNRPCWLFTNSEQDKNGSDIAIKVDRVPVFSRYKIFTNTKQVMRSLDFGMPEEIYVPSISYNPDTTIYNAIWRNYISDLYDKDTRILNTKMYFRETPDINWLRRFYWFDNAIWRMTKIKDYNVARDVLTDVEFVKVKDLANYALAPIKDTGEERLVMDSNEVAQGGGTIGGTIYLPYGGNWFTSDSSGVLRGVDASGVTHYYEGNITPYTGTGTESRISVVFPANETDGEMTWTIHIEDDFDNSFEATVSQHGLEPGAIVFTDQPYRVGDSATTFSANYTASGMSPQVPLQVYFYDASGNTPDWLSGTVNTGQSKVIVTVSGNTGASRRAYMALWGNDYAGNLVTGRASITQSATTIAGTITWDMPSVTVGSGSTNIAIGYSYSNIRAEEGTWVAIYDDDMITRPSWVVGINNSGSSSCMFTVEPNTGNTARHTNIEILAVGANGTTVHDEIVLTQTRNTASLSVYPLGYEWLYPQYMLARNIGVTGDTSYTATTNNNNFTISPTTGTGATNIVATPAGVNTGYTDLETIVTITDGQETINVALTQGASPHTYPDLRTDDNIFDCPSSGYRAPFTFPPVLPGTYSFMFSGQTEWCYIVDTGGTKVGTRQLWTEDYANEPFPWFRLVIDAQPQFNPQDRSTTIWVKTFITDVSETVLSSTFTIPVSQASGAGSIEWDASSLSVGSGATSITATYTYDNIQTGQGTWVSIFDDDMITVPTWVSAANNSANTSVVFTVQANTGNTARHTNVEILAVGENGVTVHDEIVLTQARNSANLVVSPLSREWLYAQSALPQGIGVTGDTSYTATTSNNNFTISPTTGTGSTDIIATPAGQNDSYSAKTTTVTITDGDNTFNVTLTQGAAPHCEPNIKNNIWVLDPPPTGYTTGFTFEPILPGNYFFRFSGMTEWCYFTDTGGTPVSNSAYWTEDYQGVPGPWFNIVITAIPSGTGVRNGTLWIKTFVSDVSETYLSSTYQIDIQQWE